MSYEISTTPDALRDAKRLAKKYASFKSNFAALVASLTMANFPKFTSSKPFP